MKDFMIHKREALGLTLHQMAQRCDCSEGLLSLLEEGDRDITHPHIASRIAKEYGLKVEEYNRLVHEKHKATKLPKPKKAVHSVNLDEAWRSGWGKKGGDMEEC